MLTIVNKVPSTTGYLIFVIEEIIISTRLVTFFISSKTTFSGINLAASNGLIEVMLADILGLRI